MKQIRLGRKYGNLGTGSMPSGYTGPADGLIVDIADAFGIGHHKISNVVPTDKEHEYHATDWDGVPMFHIKQAADGSAVVTRLRDNIAHAPFLHRHNTGEWIG